jgi:hypothetical protein
VWAVAAAPGIVGTWTSTAGAFAAVALIPGWLLSRRIGFPCAGSLPWITHPARALTFSIAMIAGLELVCASVELGMTALLGLLAAVSVLLALLPVGASDQSPESQSTDTDAVADRVALLSFLALVVAAVVLAAAGDNIARDRMWYSAWINSLAVAETLDWSEPFFGTQYIPARFVHNAWLAALGAIAALSRMPAPDLLADFLPPVLTLCAASATWMLADVVFGRGYKASVGGLAGLLVLLTSSYPFFSPERYAFFGRLPEDKFVALLIFMPVAIATLWRFIDKVSLRAAVMAWAACTAVAFSHAIVQLLLVLSIVPYFLWRSIAMRSTSFRTTTVAVAILAATSLAPGLSALKARSQIVETPTPVTVFEDDVRHPVVRSHIRMDRLIDIPLGGPVVAPRLIAEPVLFLSLLGLVAAARRRKESWAPFLLSASLVHLALAFAPYIAPLFGRLVVPWMAYRALWGIPFGLLVAALLIELVRSLTPASGRARGPVVVTVGLLVGGLTFGMPWSRLEDVGEPRAGIDSETQDLLDEISDLPPTSRIAAAAGLSELIPAFTGHHVLAFSDRGTVVFTGVRRHAERRLIANAVLLGLYGGSPRLRNRVVSDFDITHTVYEREECDRRSAEIYKSTRFTLCAERFHTSRRFRMRRTTAVAADGPRGPVRAVLGDVLHCEPKPEFVERTKAWRWTRAGRWSGAPVVINCEAEFPRATPVGTMRIALNLPKASEALVYRAKVVMADGGKFKRQGVVEFRENPNGELRLPEGLVKRISVRIVPAYLPYFNAEALDLRS